MWKETPICLALEREEILSAERVGQRLEHECFRKVRVPFLSSLLDASWMPGIGEQSLLFRKSPGVET